MYGLEGTRCFMFYRLRHLVFPLLAVQILHAACGDAIHGFFAVAHHMHCGTVGCDLPADCPLSLGNTCPDDSSHHGGRRPCCDSHCGVARRTSDGRDVRRCSSPRPAQHRPRFDGNSSTHDRSACAICRFLGMGWRSELPEPLGVGDALCVSLVMHPMGQPFQSDCKDFLIRGPPCGNTFA